jgi:DNA-binding MarR family transcriptional regulator
MSLSECHIVAQIGQHESVNGTFLAKNLNITKGGVSKSVTKLVNKGLVEIKKLPNNRKEVHYSLTELGVKVFAVHEKMHESAQDEIKRTLVKYDEGALTIISNFLDDITKTFD